MSKRQPHQPLEDGPHPCHFGCGRSLATKWNRQTYEGWEWFTEYGAETLHFCPQCRRARQFEIDQIRAKLKIKPANWPQERAKL